MTIAEIQQEILRMKKEQDICILAHAYQGQEILEVADYTGDSYGLSVQASKRDCSGVIMCGVRFMAETCKILSPKKRVWLANPVAGCPMAEQLDLEGLRELKAQYPDYAVVAYINTTSELKTECDVCVTSSSAVEICKKLEQDKILFIPDPNLGHYVAEKLPEKTFAFYKGGCPRHIVVSAKDVEKACIFQQNHSALRKKWHGFTEVDQLFYINPLAFIMIEVHSITIRIQCLYQILFILLFQICFLSIEKIHLFKIS